MPLGFLLKAVKGCDYDSDELYKSPQHAAFIKNICLDLNENPSTTEGSAGRQGDGKGIFSPVQATEELCPFPLPSGDNYCIGYHESEETNEGYVFVYNTLFNHLIYVINGYTGQCEVIKRGACLGFTLLPENFISLGRCVLIVVSYFNPATHTEDKKKYLIYTDNNVHVRFISVTDAILTGGYDLPFFKSKDCAECDILNLGVPTPASCIQIQPVARPIDDNRDNLLQNKAFQFRVKNIDVFKRASEHGLISDLWYPSGGACSTQSTGQARCLDLTFDSGCAIVEKIQIEYRIWNANAPDLSVPTDWLLHETIDKYDQSNGALKWWERPVNPDYSFDPATNRITYRFCADKGTTALPVEETTKRNASSLPLTSSSVFSLNKGIGLANNRRGFPPLDKNTLKEISFTVEKPTLANSCSPKPRTIIVYGHIMNMLDVRPMPLKKDGDNVIYGFDTNSRLYEFGQYLAPGQEGIIGYFAGTSDYVISEQVRYNIATGQYEEVGLDFMRGITDPAIKLNYVPYYLPVQRWKFVGVTPGKKIFRVAAPRATPQDDYQKTSFVTGGTSYFPNYLSYKDADAHEIVIDVCEGDVDLTFQNIILGDLTKVVGSISNVIQGYLYEDEVSKIPVEKALIDAPSHTKHPAFTDHNGFYWAASHKDNWHVDLYGTKACDKNGYLVGTSPNVHDAPDSRFRDQVFYAYNGTKEFPKSDRVYVKGRIVLCDQPAVGLGGVGVMLTGGATATTDDNGYFTLIAHDQAGTKAREDKLMIVQKGVCQIGRCDNACSSCFDDIPVKIPPCAAGLERTVQIPAIGVKVQTAGIKGPQNGGRYELGILAHNYIGQMGYVQRLESHAVDIPTIGQTGVYDFSKIRYSIGANAVFPEHVRYLTIVISRNLNYEDFLTWVAEKVEYVDNTGKVNNVNPTQVKLHYAGLNEYSAQNGFATNAVWQFLDEKSKPTIGDKVELITNGDGNLFTKRIVSLVKFDEDGQYVLIDYNEDLKNLKDGLQMKLIRPRSNTNSQYFYEQCAVIPVDKGKARPANASGVLNYFDAYMVNRSIPIPYYDEKGEKDTSKSTLKNYTFPFEHHSPSDFWGDHAANRGRFFVVNPYENQLVRSTEIQLSKAVVNDGLLNGLSYFEDNDATEFDKQEWGYITVVVPSIGFLTVICQQNNFVVPFDDNTVRVVGNQLTFIPLDKRLGRPQAKQGSDFGCDMADINTIREYEGVIMFLDRTQAALVQLAGSGVDISYNGFKGHLKAKIKFQNRYNQLNNENVKYFHAVIDPVTKKYLLTNFTLPRRGEGSGRTQDDYVNRLRAKSVDAHETMAIGIYTQALHEQYSFTPEYYGTLYGHATDTQLISFKGGRAHIHHQKPGTVNKYAEIYGELVDFVYDVVLNVSQDSEKRFLWTEVLSRQQLFFADKILTDSGQESRLLKSAWEKRENFFTAEFRRDLKTPADPNLPSLADPNKLILEGNTLSGRWIRVRYVARPSSNLKYFEFDGVHIFVFASEKSGTDRS